MKTQAILAIVLGIATTSIAPAAADPGDGCSLATTRFQEHYALRGRVTEDVAETLKAAAEECSADAEGDPVSVSLSGGDVGTARAAPPMCWGLGNAEATHEGAPVTGSLAVPQGEKEIIDDSGPATLTYHAASGFMTYTVRGDVWGFTASNTGKGVVYVGSVSFPATTAYVAGGCGFEPGWLCWGEGTVSVNIENPTLGYHTLMYLRSEFFDC
ncbi:MAG TPA: hypothetical protein VHH36_08225 [Candidatus Thermoplasmatota archaeon]|nr:hypothetical protein [Candidatus Thermoplasmatota archaeon]